MAVDLKNWTKSRCRSHSQVKTSRNNTKTCTISLRSAVILGFNNSRKGEGNICICSSRPQSCTVNHIETSLHPTTKCFFQGRCKNMYSLSLLTTMALVLALMVSLNAPVVLAGDGFVSSIVDTYDLLYNKGVEAYARQRWFECLTHLNGALTDYRVYRSTLITCKRECRKKSSSDDGALSTKPQMSELQIFFRILKRSNCLRKCKQNHFGHRPDVLASKSVEEDFETRKPYDFLQFCHYKVSGNKIFFVFKLVFTDAVNMKYLYEWVRF